MIQLWRLHRKFSLDAFNFIVACMPVNHLGAWQTWWCSYCVWKAIPCLWRSLSPPVVETRWFERAKHTSPGPEWSQTCDRNQVSRGVHHAAQIIEFLSKTTCQAQQTLSLSVRFSVCLTGVRAPLLNRLCPINTFELTMRLHEQNGRALWAPTTKEVQHSIPHAWVSVLCITSQLRSCFKLFFGVCCSVYQVGPVQKQNRML